MSATVATVAVPVIEDSSAGRSALASYLELTKPRITLLVTLTAAAGFFLGSPGQFDYVLCAHTLAAVALLSSGVATLNQYIERDLDARMRRTAQRPLPTGRLAPRQALVFGVLLTVVAELYLLVAVNALSALLGLSVAMPDDNSATAASVWAQRT